jgi:hypothetical protein
LSFIWIICCRIHSSRVRLGRRSILVEKGLLLGW